MFPVAVLILDRAIRATGLPSAAVGTAVVAAAVKLADFAVPGADPVRIVNPALSILLEGLAVAGWYALSERAGRSPGFLGALSAGLAWRGAFCLHLGAISLFGLPAALVTGGLPTLLRFLVGESLANAALIAVLLVALRRLLPAARPDAAPGRFALPLAAAALVAAVAATVLL